MKRLESLLLVGMGAAVLAACPPTSESPDPGPSPRILSFSASKSEVARGERVTLSWETAEAATVELRDGRRGIVSGFDPSSPAGSVTTAVDEDALFVLTAENARGVRDSAVIAVRAGLARQLTFVATPARIVAGEPVVLAWMADSARNVVLKDASGAAIDLRGQVQSGSVVVRPSVDATYSLVVDGTPHEATVTVLPTVTAFTATPASARAGEDVELSWHATGAARVTVSRVGGAELHSETTPSQVADGSFTYAVPTTVHPAEVLAFELKAYGADPSNFTVARLEVFVAGRPAIRAWAAPAYSAIGGSFEVTWRTVNADSVEILRGHDIVYSSPAGVDVSSGSTRLATPGTTATYVLRARDERGGLAVSEPVAVSPVGKPVVTSFDASATGVNAGGDPVTLSWNVPSARALHITANGEHLVTGTFGLAAETGTQTVYPNEDTTYELTADNGVGDVVTASVLVTVATPASLTWTPPMAPVGAQVALTGTTASQGALLGLPWVNAGTGTFIDITSTGVNAGLRPMDKESVLFTLPESFSGTFFGLPVSTDVLNISMNGWFDFDPDPHVAPDDSTQAGMAKDLPPLSFAPLYDDFSAVSSPVFVQLDELSGEQRLIVQWNDVYVDGTWNSTKLTFQAQLYSSGRIVYAYDVLDVDGLLSPAIGVVDPFGATAVSTPYVPGQGDVISFFEAITPPLPLIASDVPVVARAALTGGFLQFEEVYPAIAPNQFVITEVNASPASGVTDGQWFEVLNRTSNPVPLDGWTIDFGGGSTHVVTQATLAPNGSLVFGQSAGAGDGVAVDYVYGSGHALAPGGTLSFDLAGAPYTQLQAPAGVLAPGYTWQLGGIHSGMSVYQSALELGCAAAASSVYGSTGQHGTPGAPNTPCPNHLAPQSIPSAFTSISTTGTLLSFQGNDDEGVETVTFPTPVVIGRVAYGALTIATNGFVSLQPLTCDPAAWDCFYESKTALDPTTAPFGVIAPFWDDLFPNPGGGTFWEQRDPDGVPGSGDERTIVSWELMARYNDGDKDDEVSFQVHFLVTGVIEFHYGTLFSTENGTPVNAGITATTWLEDPSGHAAWIVNAHQTTPGIASNSGYRFTAQ